MRPGLAASALLATACLMAAGPPGLAPATASASPGVAVPGIAVPGVARPTAASSTTAWRPPVIPLIVDRRFTPPAERWLAGHRGVDLRTSTGAVVRAAGAGRVTYAATLAGRGVVVVDHGRLRTTYEPVEAAVQLGALVLAGAPIGVVAPGSGHCGDGRCLHLGLRQGSTYLDPLLILRPTAALLRPW
jgi:murein DD-endopeptidase MepM/ murein hydrolase activator NlpD